MKITSKQELRELYGSVSVRAQKKVLNTFDKHATNFIAHSPFFVLASTDSKGKMDNSPRGGKPGFVKVKDNTLIIPDAKGNNRVDSLINIVETGQIGLLFLIPGVDETLRINGKASITTDPELIALFQDKSPIKSVILVEVQELFLHCAKALMRSELWSEHSKIERSSFPTMGKMLKDQLNSSDPEESHEDMIKRYLKDI
ncbi:MAG: pyridoxamine 5'-phosphate oxidase family protein [Bacteroidia bacterium]